MIKTLPFSPLKGRVYDRLSQILSPAFIAVSFPTFTPPIRAIRM